MQVQRVQSNSYIQNNSYNSKNSYNPSFTAFLKKDPEIDKLCLEAGLKKALRSLQDYAKRIRCNNTVKVVHKAGLTIHQMLDDAKAALDILAKKYGIKK